MARKDVNAVLKICSALLYWLDRMDGKRCLSIRVQVVVRLVGEQSIHRDQDKMREQFLFDTALGFGVEVLDLKDPFADLVEFLYSPSSMVHIH